MEPDVVGQEFRGHPRPWSGDNALSNIRLLEAARDEALQKAEEMEDRADLLDAKLAAAQEEIKRLHGVVRTVEHERDLAHRDREAALCTLDRVSAELRSQSEVLRHGAAPAKEEALEQEVERLEERGDLLEAKLTAAQEESTQLRDALRASSADQAGYVRQNRSLQTAVVALQEDVAAARRSRGEAVSALQTTGAYLSEVLIRGGTPEEHMESLQHLCRKLQEMFPADREKRPGSRSKESRRESRTGADAHAERAARVRSSG
mmetsp:Transcript_17184/g.41370  ORF Transcript_17184/g.41370 Transcript_17184/m.41370 type:complete len:262 (-) Transcript_17184:37-822(-)